jgi:putative membrane protein
MDGMHPAHHGDGTGGLPGAVLTALILLTAAGGYLLAVCRARRRNPVQGWNAWRSASFLTGLGLLAVALLPPLGPAAHTDFRGHMAQHMFIGMYAPLALILAAPVTLLPRTLPPAPARRVTAVLHNPLACVLAHPEAALLLTAGTLGLLYFTPLFNTLVDYGPPRRALADGRALPGVRVSVRVRHRGPRPCARPARRTGPARRTWASRSPHTH